MSSAHATAGRGGLLSGVRVLDFTRALAGPFCTRMMADMGAEVIKIEPPGGDSSRNYEYLTPEGVSGYFIQQNCGKMDVCVNLGHSQVKDALLQLVSISDVVVENFRPGVMLRQGLAYEDLRKVNPSIIMCSISGFGEGSPYAHRAGGDMIIQSMSGLASLTGDPNGPPQTVGMAVSDTASGAHAFGAICAALYHRSITGRGQRIEFALMDCVLWQNEWASQSIFLSGGKENPMRYGNRRPILVPGNVFQGKDGSVTIATSTDAGWENLAQAMGMPELAKDPRFYPRSARFSNRDELERMVAEWIMSFDSVREVEEILADKGGVQCAWVRTWKEMLEDRHVEARGLVAHVEDPFLGRTAVMNSPFHLSEADSGVQGPAPLLGQHTVDIFQALLGLSAEEIVDMFNVNAIHADDRIVSGLLEPLLEG